MDADIKALEKEVAKINPPPHVIQPPTQPSIGPSGPPASYKPSHSQSIKPPLQFHPYQPPGAHTKPARGANPNSAAQAMLHQQMAAATARSAIAAAATTAARLQAQAAAITAARTRTLMSAAAQAQARAAAIVRSQHIIQSGPNTHSNSNSSSSNHNKHNSSSTSTSNSRYMQPSERKEEPASVGPSYTKNNGVTAKYNKLGYHGMRGTNYKRYDYDYNKKSSSSSNHNKHNSSSTSSSNSRYMQPSERKEEPASVGPSYTKNNGVTAKYNKLGYHGMRGTNYKRYDYDYNKKSTTTIPNSSLRGHHHGGYHGRGRYDNRYHGHNGGYDDYGEYDKPMKKKKKLKATHQFQLRTAANEKWVDPTMTDWPENDFRIFCGDLGNEVSDAMLTSAFSKYPSFAKAKVVRDKRTGKSKGYGFVSFLEPHDFIRAFKEMNGKYVGNRPIKLRRSKWKERMKKVKNFKIRE
eukprot:CAMPEP_0201592656 /NCGR_PEP_ID=MMETSP0190_2-20130828/190491_1 /ASSEMBLY_ACC=CAM_ASM_000263 /TAXON_ID=37353 /ORGANISM="Rosalina sp." /LENGTH=464 /DNA_ID=CAMNT_0048051525 /DNA_START=129 /DNA_END=1523 /DNA_ORIENTATION=+